MNDLRTAAQQALEAMQSVDHATWAWACVEAIASLRAALADQVQDRTGWPPGMLQDDSRDLSRWLAAKPDAMQRAREAQKLADQVQEPVALETVYETIIHWDEGGGKRSRRELARRIVALYTAPPQREPLTAESIEQAIGYRLPEYAMQALLKLLNTKPGHCEDCGKTLIQMAEPVKPLTDEVIADLWHQNGGYHHHFARAVERWLRGQP